MDNHEHLTREAELLDSGPDAEPQARMDPWWWLVALVVGILVLLLVLQPDPFLRIFKFVSDGLRITVLTTVASFLMVIVVGLFGGLGRLSTNRFIYGISTLYVELIRGIPLLVQLIWWYFAFPPMLNNLGEALNLPVLSNYKANPVVIAILGMTVCYGAYMSEIYRAGIQSIPTGQMEAARSLGMSYPQAMRHIIIPQAFRVILPPLGNEFISLLKDSSLVSVVAVADLTRRGREFMSTTFMPIPTWTMIALIYLVMTLFSARMVSLLERRSRFER